MPGFSVKVIGLTDPPPMDQGEIGIHVQAAMIDCYVINGGMESGQPSIALVVQSDHGPIVIETSLLALVAGARVAAGMAETNFGWTMPP